MGRLISRNQLDLNPDWYFEDAYQIGSSAAYLFEWPSPSFPHLLYIHYDHLDNGKKIKIRQWVQNNVSDTVIMDHYELSYRRYYDNRRDWEAGHEVRNIWVRFSFEDFGTALMFKTTFSDLVRAPTQHHPDQPNDEEWCKLNIKGK
jgi:pterin-4a-carbinolamine dehydratase